MLAAEMLAAYRRDGFVVVPRVLSTREAAALDEEERRLWIDAEADLDRPGVHWRKHETLGRVADRLDPVFSLSDAFASIADDRRMTALAAAALGAPCVFFKDKLIAKPPGTFGYELHHDYAYWSELGIPASEFVTLFLALDPCDELSGALELFPGLHERTLAPHPHDPLDIDPAAVDGSPSRTPTLGRGDVIVFHSKLPHRSAPNRSAHPRRVYILTYMHERHRNRVPVRDRLRRESVYHALARGSD